MAMQIDLVLDEDNCNLRCDYCMIRMKPTVTRHHLDIGQTVGLVNQALEHSPVPILRISGGEVFLYPNLLEFLQEIRSIMPAVEIITNGTLLDGDMVDSLSRIGNIHIKYSLDGHCHEMNRYRFRNERAFAKVLDHFRFCVAADLGLGIFSVVSDINSNRLVEFVRFVNDLGRPIPIYFLPVRHVYGKSIEASAAPFVELTDQYENYQRVLFSRSYLNSLAEFVATQARSLPCFAQKNIVALNQEGDVHMCPCGFPGSRGNVYDGELTPPMDSTKFGFCRGCYTDYDVLSLVARGDMTIEQLGKDPVFRVPRVRASLDEVLQSLASSEP